MTASQEMVQQATRNESVLASYSQEQLEHLRNYITPGFEDSEIAFFLAVAKQKNLDPLKRQIYAVKFRQNVRKNVNGKWVDNWVAKIDTLTGIDGYRAIAARCGDYAPGDESLEIGQDGLPISATTTVQKLVQGTWIKFSATAYFDEYCVYKREKDGNGPARRDGKWDTMPKRMIAKCSEALALRKGWPEELCDVRTSDEMARTLSESQEGERFSAIPPEQERPMLVAATSPAKVEVPKSGATATEVREFNKDREFAKLAAVTANPQPSVATQTKQAPWTKDQPIPDVILKVMPPPVRELAGIPLANLSEEDLELVLEQGKNAYNAWRVIPNVVPKLLALLQEIIVSAQLLLDSRRGFVPPPDDAPMPESEHGGGVA